MITKKERERGAALPIDFKKNHEFLSRLEAALNAALADCRIPTNTLRKDLRDKSPAPYTFYLQTIDGELEFDFFRLCTPMSLYVYYNTPGNERPDLFSGRRCASVTFDALAETEIIVYRNTPGNTCKQSYALNLCPEAMDDDELLDEESFPHLLVYQWYRMLVLPGLLEIDAGVPVGMLDYNLFDTEDDRERARVMFCLREGCDDLPPLRDCLEGEWNIFSGRKFAPPEKNGVILLHYGEHFEDEYGV